MDIPSDTFPRGLLKRPIPERLDYFQRKLVKHDHLVQADRELSEALRYPGDATLIFVFGPSGVGKSTLRQRVESRLVEQLRPALLADPERIPYVSVEAVSPETGFFNWKRYYRRALTAIVQSADLVEELRVREGRDAALSRTGHRRVLSKYAPVEELRLALEDALSHCRPSAFFMDEAHHLANSIGGRWFMSQMENLKSLASTTGTPHVLLGTYGLLHLVNLSAQLARRSIHVHFPRYRFDRADELHAFKRVLLSLQNHLPLPKPPDLVTDAEFLYLGSVGCVGRLKGWLYRALAHALESGDKTLTHQHLARFYDASKVLEAATEIEQGEQALAGDPRYYTHVRTLLGMPVAASPIADPGASPRASLSPPAAKTRSKHVQRKPARDRIGAAQP